MNADLQYHAAWHTSGLIAPRGEVELSEPVAADIGFRIDNLAENAGIDLLPDIAEMAFAPSLIAEPKHDAGLAGAFRDGKAFGHRIGNRLVEENMLARLGRRPRRLQMDVVGGGIDDRLDGRVGEDRLIARRSLAAVLLGKGPPLVIRSGEAGRNLDLAGSFDGVGQHIRPPAHADRGYAYRPVG